MIGCWLGLRLIDGSPFVLVSRCTRKLFVQFRADSLLDQLSGPLPQQFRQRSDDPFWHLNLDYAIFTHGGVPLAIASFFTNPFQQEAPPSLISPYTKSDYSVLKNQAKLSAIVLSWLGYLQVQEYQAKILLP